MQIEAVPYEKLVRAKPRKPSAQANGYEQPLCPISQQPMYLRQTIVTDWRRPTVAEQYQLYWNDKSEYGLLYPRPTLEETFRFYDVDNYYTHADSPESRPSVMIPSFSAWLLMRLSYQMDHGREIDSASWFREKFGEGTWDVLDLGCGRGRILKQLSADGHRVVGIEPDSISRNLAQNAGLEVWDGTAEKFPEQLFEREYDFVIMTHVLEHCVDPVLALQNCTRLLKKGGRLIVELPNNNCIGFQHAGVTWRWLDAPRHLNFFTPKSLQAMSRQVGLEPTTMEFYGYCRQFLPDWLEDEQLIWDRLHQADPTSALPPRNSLWRAAQLLAKTLFVRDEQKYDALRLIATKS